MLPNVETVMTDDEMFRNFLQDMADGVQSIELPSTSPPSSPPPVITVTQAPEPTSENNSETKLEDEDKSAPSLPSTIHLTSNLSAKDRDYRKTWQRIELNMKLTEELELPCVLEVGDLERLVAAQKKKKEDKGKVRGNYDDNSL